MKSTEPRDRSTAVQCFFFNFERYVVGALIFKIRRSKNSFCVNFSVTLHYYVEAC